MAVAHWTAALWRYPVIPTFPLDHGWLAIHSTVSLPSSISYPVVELSVRREPTSYALEYDRVSSSDKKIVVQIRADAASVVYRPVQDARKPAVCNPPIPCWKVDIRRERVAPSAMGIPSVMVCDQIVFRYRHCENRCSSSRVALRLSWPRVVHRARGSGEMGRMCQGISHGMGHGGYGMPGQVAMSKQGRTHVKLCGEKANRPSV